MLKTSEVQALRSFLQNKISLPVTFQGDKFDAFVLGVQQTFNALIEIPELCIRKMKIGKVAKTASASKEAVPGDK